MYPRLYMQSVQHVTCHPMTERITFETRLANGRRFHFLLNKNQFLNFNDAVTLINKDNSSGHFPLGQNTWFHYNAFDASFYKNKHGHGRINFVFTSFDEYKNFTHDRLLSLVRLNDTPTVKRRDGRGGKRDEEAKPTSHKRPLSGTVQLSDQSPTTKRARRKPRKTTSRAANDAIMSHDDEESPVLPERYHSNTRRWCDSVSSFSSTSKDLPSPTAVRLDSPYSSDTMDGE